MATTSVSPLRPLSLRLDVFAHRKPFCSLPQAQSTAEADMQIIRNKRQSSTGGAANAQQKNKYRKRSVSVYLVFFCVRPPHRVPRRA